MISSKPALAHYDRVADAAVHDEGASNDDLDRLTGLYLSFVRELGRRYTCVIPADPYFSLWVFALDLRFKGRLHMPFLKLTSAIRVLEMAGRP
jgi:hypothetical protein